MIAALRGSGERRLRFLSEKDGLETADFVQGTLREVYRINKLS